MERPNSPSPSNTGNNGNTNWRGAKRNRKPANKQNGAPRDPRGHQSNIRQPQRQHQYRGGGNNRRVYNRDDCSGRYFNFTRLDELSRKNGDEVLTILGGKKTEFNDLLCNITTPDLLVITLRVLTNVCQANFTEILTSLLSCACSARFLNTLEAFLTKLPFESPIEKMKNKLYHEDKNRFWSNLIEFFKKVIELLPTKARDELTGILQKIDQIFSTIEMSQNYKIDEEVKRTALNISKEMEEEMHKIEEKNQIHATMPQSSDVEELPPEDFRSLRIIPTVEDLYDQKPFIRSNKIKDAYNSVEHYLDVQFRLLREDFVRPLRTGLQEYLHASHKYRNNDLRVYRNVKFVAPEIIKNNVGIMVYFGMIKGINWYRSKRFMFGALLLLSNDNFNTLIFATIANRDEKQCEKGYVLIEPCEGTIITRDMYNTEFVMLESKIYFEPYLAVLNALQHMNEENFPMEKYLIKADTSSDLPRYLRDCKLLRCKDFDLPIGNDDSWPPAKIMNLDETQYSAFKSALTQEFAVIQGPPGTGKTFIALEIVKTLLENYSYWECDGPIVIVCLTNHALDQFLEAIVKYTESIVRIGARSKSEILKPYSLMERRKSSWFYRNGSPIMFQTKDDLASILKSIEKTRLLVKLLTTPDAIVPLNCLTAYCHDRSFNVFKSTEELLYWLIGIHITLDPDIAVPLQQLNFPEIMPEDGREEDENMHMDDELELEYKSGVDETFEPVFPLTVIDKLINNKYLDIREYKNLVGEMHALPFDPTIEMEEDVITLCEQRLFLQRNLAQHPILNRPRYPPNNRRWRLYWIWVKRSYDNAMNKLTKLETEYRQVRSRLNEAKQLVDLKILQQHKIVGLTTSGAARLHASLRALHSPIVLVEEAAEILEAHVVCSLTQACQHTILIGDHKQLRPKASVYELGTKHNLDISLFERMVNIRGNCTQLAHQHRMRPQIAKLITPSIYETLYNHDSVQTYPDVKGLEKNLFFLNHNNRETSHNNEESWMNQYEATFLVAFARHLIMQGYNGEEITVLCTYTGQLFALMKETARYAILKQVRVTTVDNYQGEENRIILLSLVRNNGEGNIGFLKEENRVCVALSRAREGLYIMGNMDDLVVKNNIWPKIKKVLENENAIGNTLVVRCQIHSDQSIPIKDVNDFQQCPEGGCSKKCGADLSCGHSCTSICHVLDREHEEYQCKHPCIKSCPDDHPCPLKCWEGCKPCGIMVERKLECEHSVQMPCSSDVDKFPCYIEIGATLPDCNHEIRKPCYRSLTQCKCTHPCENRLPCGHTCRLSCHVTSDPDHIEYQCFKDCPKNNLECVNNHPCKKRCYEECGLCPIFVAKTRTCGHYYKRIQCTKNVEELTCMKKCKRTMDCGHKCLLRCCKPCGNCQVKVTKMSSCGHDINVKCCEEATPSKCNGKCQKKLACGHPCTAKCKDPCITNCKNMVRQNKPGLCGHIFSIPCYLLTTGTNSREVMKYCKEPCRVPLACTHLCGGTCGACEQGRIHQPCVEPCGNILVCGHKCDVPCRQACAPCNKPCELKCRHSKCNKKCGIPCTPCVEPCAWGCEHRMCTKRCSQLCDIEPCNEPCKKRLKCGHPCVGFCGDPCPPLCLVCDKEKLTEIFLGYEDEPGARFVFLEDCGHCIESNGLIAYLEKSNKSIQMKVCPLCTTPIRKCMRIMNQIKTDLKDVILVKKKIFGNPTELRKQQALHCVEMLNMSENRILAEFTELKMLLDHLYRQGTPVINQKRQILNSQEVETYRVLLIILRQIFDALESITRRDVDSYQFVKCQVTLLVESLPTRRHISNQELEDINLEVQRLNYLAEMCRIDGENIKDGIVRMKQEDYDAAMANLLSFNKFTEDIRSKVKSIIIRIENFKSKVVNDRQMLVKAMNFRQGHWFKCPNGHPYTIADCGGAMQISKCADCGVPIGGESHRLISGNSLASEMDGATHSAWPGTGM